MIHHKSVKLLRCRFIHDIFRAPSLQLQQQFNNAGVGRNYLRSSHAIAVDSYGYASLLQTCVAMKDLQQGKKIHAHLFLTGNQSNMMLQSKLVAMYANCQRLEYAHQVFEKMPEPNLFLWNFIIAQFVMDTRYFEAIELYHRMQGAGVKPDNYTFPPILKACAQLNVLQEGIEIHDYIRNNGFKSNIFVENALVDMYAKCGRLENARQVFDKMSKRDVVSWNAMVGGYVQSGHCAEAMELFWKMKGTGIAPGLVTWNAVIAGYAQNDNGDEALKLLRQMLAADVKPNAITVASVLPACAQLRALQHGKEIHGYAMRNSFEWNVVVENALIDMYAKCGKSESAFHIFQTMSRKTESSWNAMIAVYARSGHYDESLGLFQGMQVAGIKPNSVTIVTILPVVSHLSVSHKGKEIHDFILRSGLGSNVKVGNALIDMYSKCGNIRLACQVFEQMPKRDVVSWTAMISGYGMQGKGGDVMALFSQMQVSGMKPDYVFFIALLSACSHCGLIAEGWQYFDMMRENYGISPRMEHYACMVDLLGRAGCFEEAVEFIKKMPIEPSAAVWATLLGACRIYSNLELGQHVSDCLFKLNPEEPGYYLLMANIYGAARRWDDLAKVRKNMREHGLQKNPGWSWIEVKNQAHAFLAGDEWV